MRKSLSAIRARVERLALQVGPKSGCATCREAEAQIRLCPVLNKAEVHAELAKRPDSETCDRCGRTYTLHYTLVVLEMDDEAA